MKRTLTLAMVMLCSFATAVCAQGPCDYAPERPHRGERPPIADDQSDRERHHFHDQRQKERTIRVLRETNDYLSQAQQAAHRGGYRDGLGRAFAHQDEAKMLMRQGRFERAISHSMRAQEIARDIIRINRGYRRPGHERPHRDYNRHDDLDNSLDMIIRDDKAALRIHLNLD